MFAGLLEKLALQRDLTTDEAASAMAEVMAGRATQAQIGGLLVGLRLKGERPAEVVGFASTMRAHAVRLSREYPEAFDTCGTGGDGAGTFNISSVVAIVVASCGVLVAKHGNRSVSSRCGSADVFEALGVDVTAPPDRVERCLTDAGIAFLFAPTFHPSMRHAGQARRDLGLRTAFNLLGPLTNPAGARRQLVGVPRPEMTELVATALARLGSHRAWVVHGADGLDELSTCGYTKVSECRAGLVHTFYVHPADFGLRKTTLDALTGGTADDNATLTRNVLSGQGGPARDIVVLNAGAALLIAGVVATVREGMEQAIDAIDSGRSASTLARMASCSRGEDA
ncbi:MAG: trpD [Acidobacteria bacterium]|jgi:anthranilate phosphoribosyltransferase|nr:trpD [Acidobacteriota bacterium]